MVNKTGRHSQTGKAFLTEFVCDNYFVEIDKHVRTEVHFLVYIFPINNNISLLIKVLIDKI